MTLRPFFAAAIGFLAVACAAGGPKVAPDQSAVYGKVIARPHSALLAKWTEEPTDAYNLGGPGKVNLPDDAIDYDSLTGIYVGLVDPAYTGGTTHDITFTDAGARPESLAVAVGDVIRVRNATAKPITCFLAAVDGVDFQDMPELAAGQTAELRVGIEGLLELATDEDERLVAPVLARAGLRTTQVVSGGNYQFIGLAPGAYNMTFWYWRLGSVERSVRLEGGRTQRVDEVLAVDRTVK